jgi:hypothetical protein
MIPLRIFFWLGLWACTCSSFLWCQEKRQEPSALDRLLPSLRTLREEAPLQFETLIHELFPEFAEEFLKEYWTRERLESIRESDPFPYLERLNRYFPLTEDYEEEADLKDLQLQNPDQYWYLLEQHHPSLFQRKRLRKQLHSLARQDFQAFRQNLREHLPEHEEHWLKEHFKWKELAELRKKNQPLYEQKLQLYFPEQAPAILQREKEWKELETLRKQDFSLYLHKIRILQPRRAYQIIQNELRRMELKDLQCQDVSEFHKRYQRYFPQEYQQKYSKKLLLNSLMQLKKSNFPLFLQKFKQHFPERYEKIVQDFQHHHPGLPLPSEQGK